MIKESSANSVTALLRKWGKMMDSAEMTAVRAALHSDDGEVLWAALEEVQARNVKEAVPDIVPLLRSPSEMVRITSAEILGRYADLHDATISRQLLTLFSDPNRSVRKAAAEALGILLYHPAIGDLLQLARTDEDWLVRLEAVDALERFQDPALFDPLHDLLKQEEDEDVHQYIAIALYPIAQPAHIPQLLHDIAMLHEEPRTIIYLILALYRLNAAGSLDQYVALLERVTDREDLSLIIAVLARVTTGEIPAHIRSDLPRIITVLSDVAERTPDSSVKSDAQEMIDRLRQIQAGQIFPPAECC